MKSALVMLAAGAMLFGSCSPETAPAKSPSAADTPERQTIYPCGGETTFALAQDYFADLSEALASDAGPEAFNRFLAPRFSVFRDGKYAYFDRSDFRAITPRFISREDWQRISEQGLNAVEDAGYRGCMIAHGKVWFDAYGRDGLLLKAINHDLAWDDKTGVN